MKKIKNISLIVPLVLSASIAYAGPVTLEVTAWKGNVTEPAGFPELIEKFESENPNIKVQLNYISRNDMNIVLPPRLQGNNAPDVMMVDMPLVKLWGDAGFLEKLDKKSSWYQRTLPSIKEAMLHNDNLYLQPLEVVGMGNFVNVDLMNKAGIEDVPETVDEVIAACGKFNAIGVAPMLFPAGFSAQVFTLGNGIHRSDSAPWDFGSGEASFKNDSGFASTFADIKRMADAKCFDPKLQAGIDPWTTPLTEFQSQRVGMLIHGAWNINTLSKTEGLNYVMAPVPGQKGGFALDTFSMGWAISPQTPNKEAASKFLKFFESDENLAILLKNDFGYSPYQDGIDGVPALAQRYTDIRNQNQIVMWPIYMNFWPLELEQETIDGIATFMLRPKTSSTDILENWDYVVEDSL